MLRAVQHMAKKLPVILVFDGYHSYLSLKLIELAHTHNVHLFCFPPHCTHILLPLDVAVFGPVKAAWWKVLKQHQMEACAAYITKDFPILLSKLWGSSFKPQNLVSGLFFTGVDFVLCPGKQSPHTNCPLLCPIPNHQWSLHQ